MAPDGEKPPCSISEELPTYIERLDRQACIINRLAALYVNSEPVCPTGSCSAGGHAGLGAVSRPPWSWVIGPMRLPTRSSN